MTDQCLEKRVETLEKLVNETIELIRKGTDEESIAAGSPTSSYNLTLGENSSLVNYAVDEMTRLGWMDEDTDPMQKEMVRCVLELMKVFDSQGHSGFSAPYCLNLFNRLANWRPISPLTGEDDEWEEVWGDSNLYQNKRYSAVFKEKSTGRVYNCEGKVFTKDNGKTWYSCRDSAVDITFPYTVPNEPEDVYLESEDDNG